VLVCFWGVEQDRGIRHPLCRKLVLPNWKMSWAVSKYDGLYQLNLRRKRTQQRKYVKTSLQNVWSEILIWKCIKALQWFQFEVNFFTRDCCVKLLRSTGAVEHFTLHYRWNFGLLEWVMFDFLLSWVAESLRVHCWLYVQTLPFLNPITGDCYSIP
jgi:hypothetical protein